MFQQNVSTKCLVWETLSTTPSWDKFVIRTVYSKTSFSFQAYEILSDDASRLRYDSNLDRPNNAFDDEDVFHETFDEIFGRYSFHNRFNIFDFLFKS